MKARNSQTARKQLFKKLLALRVTLPNDEQVILDSIMAEEVQGHTITSGKVLKKSLKKAALKSPEVNAHSMTATKTFKKAATKVNKKAATKQL